MNLIHVDDGQLRMLISANHCAPSLVMPKHYSDVIMSAMASEIAASRLFAQPFVQAHIEEKNQSFASVTFVRGIRR